MFTKAKIVEEAKKAIENNNLFFIQDIFAYVPFSSSLFYLRIPTDSDERKEIDALLEKNKILTKVGIRRKLYSDETPAGLLALYKLIGTQDEREALSRTSYKAEVTHTGDDVTIVVKSNKEKDKIENIGNLGI